MLVHKKVISNSPDKNTAEVVIIATQPNGKKTSITRHMVYKGKGKVQDRHGEVHEV